MRRTSVAPVAASLIAIAVASPVAHAQQAPSPPQQNLGLDDWFDWKTMTGNWGGLRTDLENDGIKIRGHYVNETSGNPVGGREQGGASTGEVMLGLDIDSHILGWDGGTFHGTLTERAGSSLSKDKIGNILTVQEIYGDGQTIRLTELSYEQKLFGGRVDVEAGHINTENDFASSPVYFGDALWCDFQNNAICGTPIAAPINTNGYVAYPASSWGARVKTYPLQNLYIEAGAYEVNPSLYLASNGLKISTNGAEGVLTAVETGIVVGQGGYVGNYRVGAYYDNSANQTVAGQLSRFVPKNSPALEALPLAEKAGRYGGWVLADQTIQRDTGSDKRGTVIFAALEYGDRETSLVNWYGEAGIVRHGTFKGRDDDTIAVGMAVASINSSLQSIEQEFHEPTTVEEYVAEANYGYQAAPWLNLRPGLQYIWHPSGTNEIRNAFVLDLKTSITF